MNNATMRKYAWAALVGTLVLSGCVPPYIVPRVESQKLDTAFILPPSDAPAWLTLDNGLDLYAWQNCYPYVAWHQPCYGLSIIALEAGRKPDWFRLLPGGPSLVSIVELVRVERPLSAHSDTDYRLLGVTFADDSRVQFNDGEVTLIHEAKEQNPNEAALHLVATSQWSTDIWRSPGLSAREAEQIGAIRFIAYDTTHLWIFAESNGPDEGLGQFAPDQLFRFTGDASDRTLHRAMFLYYQVRDDSANQMPALPRRVVKQLDPADTAQSDRIAFGAIEAPKGIFTIDGHTFVRAIRSNQPPTVSCHQSSAQFRVFLSGNGLDLRDQFLCKPFVEVKAHPAPTGTP